LNHIISKLELSVYAIYFSNNFCSMSLFSTVTERKTNEYH